MKDAVPSPCIKVCVIEECTALCFGCLRTLDEIADWGGLTNAAKRQVLLKVEVRRELVRQRQANPPRQKSV